MNNFVNALVSATPNAELKEQLHLFGQFVGEWDFEWISGKGTPDEYRLSGEWLFSWILGGTAIQDLFICPSREEKARNPQLDGEYGTTVRFYNPEKNTWNICYGLYGTMCILEAKQVGNQIIVENQDNSDGLNQWVFSDITPNSFHWQNRTSYDNGATWRVNGEVFAKRKKE